MAQRFIRNHWTVDLRWKGERIRKPSPLNTKAGAQAYEATIRGAFARGADPFFIEARKPTFLEYEERWFDTYVAAKNKPSERKQKRIILDRHLLPYFGRLRLDEIRRGDTVAFAARQGSKGFKAKTINNQLTVLRRALRSAVVDDELLDKIPVIEALPMEEADFDFLHDRELALLLGVPAPESLALMRRLAVDTGMRAGELIGLDWDTSIDLEHRLITVHQSLWKGVLGPTKNKRIRRLEMTDAVYVALRSARQPEGPVIRGEGGARVVYETTLKALQRLCESVGLRSIGWHVLRHTYATELVAAGIPLVTVQKLLGHQSVGVTMRYAHLAPPTLDRATAVLERRRERVDENGRVMGTPPERSENIESVSLATSPSAVALQNA